MRLKVLDLERLQEIVYEILAEGLHLLHILVTETHPDLHSEMELDWRVDFTRNQPDTIDELALGVRLT